MQFQLLQCEPVSVMEVIERPELANQFAAVHGVVFYGEGCNDDEFLLLAKEGPFNGESIPMPTEIDRNKCLLIEEDDLDHQLGGSSAAGEFIYKSDAIVLGRIERRPHSEHPVRITDVWLILMQHWTNLAVGRASHELRLINFPQKRIKLPRMI